MPSETLGAPTLSHKDFMSLWPTLASLARDINEPYLKVHKWLTRNYIPTQYWVNFVTAAQHRDYAVTYKLLALSCAIDEKIDFMDEKKTASL